MKRLGTVLVFKPGVTKDRARQALLQVRDVVEGGEKWSGFLNEPDQARRPWVEEYDDRDGHPVWYVP